MFERTHVVQAIGKFDQDDANVVDHRQHHFAEVLGLRFFFRREIDFADLGDAFDDVRDLLTEFLADFDSRDRGIFDGVVEETGGDGDGIHFHVGQNVTDFQWMHEVGLARRREFVQRGVSGKIRRLF